MNCHKPFKMQRYSVDKSLTNIFESIACILQEGDGSKQDWLHHTNAVRAIYRNARLNESAG